jgi:hypothetical protein
MSGKATAVFWIGLILVFLNFWLSGQSTSLWTRLSKPGAGSTGSASTPILAVGLELAMLGVAAGVASISEEVGNIMLTFMVGLPILFLIHHTAFTKAIPNLFAMVAPKTTTN